MTPPKPQYVHPSFVEQQKEAIKYEHPWLSDDELMWLDTVKAETPVFENLEYLSNGYLNAQVMEAAITERMKALAIRKDRCVQKQEIIRKLMQQFMEAVDLRRAELTEATLSIRPGAQKVIITDEEALPTDYWRIERKPKLNEIRQALKSGEAVPGCVLSNGAEIIAMRTR